MFNPLILKVMYRFKLIAKQDMYQGKIKKRYDSVCCSGSSNQSRLQGYTKRLEKYRRRRSTNMLSNWTVHYGKRIC